eukprot:Amastigsp_a5027_28.p3 type:complete len:148 gc:universal Amastigsp_a5027_28:534-91(-)
MRLRPRRRGLRLSSVSMTTAWRYSGIADARIATVSGRSLGPPLKAWRCRSSARRRRRCARLQGSKRRRLGSSSVEAPLRRDFSRRRKALWRLPPRRAARASCPSRLCSNGRSAQVTPPRPSAAANQGAMRRPPEPEAQVVTREPEPS